MSKVNQLRKMPLQLTVFEKVEQYVKWENNMQDAIRSVLNRFLMNMPLFKNLISQNAVLIIFYQKEFQWNIVLKKPSQQPIQYFDQGLLVHVAEESLDQNSQVLQFAFVDTVNVAESLNGLFDPFASFFGSHRLLSSEVDQVL